MKKMLSLLLTVILCLTMAVSAIAEDTAAQMSGITVADIQKYGNLVLSVSGTDLMAEGFSYGDIVDVTIHHRSVNAKQLRKARLVEPHRLVFKTYVQPDGLVRLIHDNLVFCGLNVCHGDTSAGRLCLAHGDIPFLFVLTPKSYHIHPICGTR